ncbi:MULTISPECIES: accessory Sec system translocase SecA2 [unclassified Mycolicibacterium]|uniref:accessory Sec system translocase SecA2 n=1 Tax=unclassified Mycolicibacterium TaxID=2636767 RepID=UPI00130C536D|nr:MULTISPECIES: accessory Sec system translocase SecA2 [unclassified Mycolicibacterium]MUL85438.1 accessory Sec system translocase SecA2 [Mycolicibacterium sp. CBMA 329]MUL88798.1 accessory Sec system translocase SecA2 [Mycolicibacterium sp. CBMA 331]MUM03062.1 accessory Sec system translocase SecA2 [Mycolicibacterium sp. CBMA 334]MUM24888.1 accessory Sec system translocase SecA2 [Mycolicibacterium sp. CBMA 295]MUM40445.1 accessory Sec system translocase SecA2 [Mycolicibacterium sp. CBMA 247]
MPKTSSAKPGRLSSKFWKLLGATTERNEARSLSEVKGAAGFEDKAAGLDDEQLTKAAKLLELQDLAQSADMPQFLALAREAADRTTSLRPFDVQLLAALRMLAGDVVEMATGEGKTLSGAIAAAGYAIGGRHVHVITINDYLARRDAEWMSPLLEALGLTIGWITADSTAEQRRKAYECDVTYASVNEIGFDVLRDQLVTDVADLVSPNPDVALIDEADSVLVDEALVPLVLAGTSHREQPRVEVIRMVGELTNATDGEEYFATDDDNRNVHLTEAGARKLEARLGGIDLYSEDHVATTLTEVNVALHAHVLLQRDVHYIVRDGAVHLINSSRGRIASLQRWPDGLQAAVEAKEGIETTETGEVLDTITVQALVNRYPTVCGMTGTALAAGEQLRQFYKLGVSPIPPNKPNVREDETDRVYLTEAAKNHAIVEHIAEVHETGQPVLVGTHDVAESEDLHRKLVKAGVPAVVLNAKNDAEEAAVIAEAGKLGSVTVSTQMAGRGTDIRLGGSDASDDSAEKEKVADLGGLHVVGTGRHPTERLDNQLRGRAGRQGDPGSSVFFSSWEDEVVAAHLDDTKLPTEIDEDGRIVAPKAAGLLDHAQRVAEGRLLDVHANTWRYNQLIAQQRAIIVDRRETLLRTDTARQELEARSPERYAKLAEDLRTRGAEETEAEDAEEKLTKICRLIMLYHLDRGWCDHLAFLADIRESIHLRALGRQNPLDEFHRMAVDAFASLAADAIEAAQQTFDTADSIEDEPGIDLSKLARPTSTWTYMVHDNPLNDDTMSALSLPGVFR